MAMSDAERRARNRAYNQRPDVKARKKAHEQRPDIKARRQAYEQRPDVKARRQAYLGAYRRRPDVKERERQRVAGSHARFRQRIDRLKEERGCRCVICNRVWKPHQLAFDHLDPAQKRFNISGGKRYTWAEVLEEIAKCRLLCHNCHADVTYEEGHHYVRRDGDVDEAVDAVPARQLRLFG